MANIKKGLFLKKITKKPLISNDILNITTNEPRTNHEKKEKLSRDKAENEQRVNKEKITSEQQLFYSKFNKYLYI